MSLSKNNFRFCHSEPPQAAKNLMCVAEDPSPRSRGRAGRIFSRLPFRAPPMRRIRNVILRFAFVWVLEGVSLLAMTLIIPGIRLEATPATTALDVARAVALVLGLINVLVRPFLLLLTLPINVRTLGFSTLIINALMIGLTAYLLPGFHVDWLGPALLGALVLAAANTALTHLTTIDDDDSFFEDLVERLSVRQQMPGSHEPGRGIVLLEIDGVGFWRRCRGAG